MVIQTEAFSDEYLEKSKQSGIKKLFYELDGVPYIMLSRPVTEEERREEDFPEEVDYLPLALARLDYRDEIWTWIIDNEQVERVYYHGTEYPNLSSFNKEAVGPFKEARTPKSNIDFTL